MAIRSILSIPDKRLKTKATPIDAVDDGLRRLMDDLMDTMKLGDQGIGLAANQIGILSRVLTIDIGPEYNKEPLFMANPEIIFRSTDFQVTSEGCLSVPEQYADVERPMSVKVRFLDRYNKAQELEAWGLLAACIQHEVDHLNGVLFIEHLPPVRRKIVTGKALKAAKKLNPAMKR